MNSLLSFLGTVDLAAFHSINALCGQSIALDHVAGRFESMELKGLLFVATFGTLWFGPAKRQIRQSETLVLLLVAIVLSLIVARLFANMLPFRTRPMFTPGIGYRAPLFETGAYFENWSSFPSDTSAIVFAMTTGFWLVSRWLGLLWAGFSVAAMGARVYFGIHYPGDVIAGALIGVAVTLAIECDFMRARVAAPIAALEQQAPTIFYALLFPFLYEVSTLFSYARGIYHAMMHLHHGLGS